MNFRTLLLAGVATTALAGYAVAQTAPQPATEPSAVPGATSSAPAAGAATAAQADARANEPRFANYKGADIVDAEKKSIATIADVLIDDDGQAHQLVIAQGGVLGVGSTYRTFEIDSLPALAEGDVQLDLTSESLAALPEYTYPSSSASAAAPAAPGGMAPATTAEAPAATTAPADGRAATEGAASQDIASLWPVSALVGTEIKAAEGAEASTTKVSDFRFSSDGKVEQVILNKGGVMGVGGETQTVPFADLSISGTPDKPVVALASGVAPKTETERAPDVSTPPPAPGGTMAPGGSTAPAQ